MRNNQRDPEHPLLRRTRVEECKVAEVRYIRGPLTVKPVIAADLFSCHSPIGSVRL